MWLQNTQQARYLCWKMLTFALLILTALAVQSGTANAQSVTTEIQEKPDIGPLGIDLTDPSSDPFLISVIRTKSPRDTLDTFVRLRDALEAVLLVYPTDKTLERANRIRFLVDQLISLVDLSSVPGAEERDVGIVTVAALLDIIGRVQLPDSKDIPSLDDFDDEGFAQYRIPGTAIHITRIEDGPREREFLFNDRSTTVAPRILAGVLDTPLKSSLGIKSWSAAMPQFTGPMVPNTLVLSLPNNMLKLWLGTPVWKIIAVLITSAIATIILLLAHSTLLRLETDTPCKPLMLRIARPLLLIGLVAGLVPFFDRQINITGEFSLIVKNCATLIFAVGSAWLAWLVMRLTAEAIIISPRIDADGLNASFIRLVTGSLGFVGAVSFLAVGAHELGLPVGSILAGLGIGGLALALAIRPTLENFIGGFILYLDKPVSVGDYCTIGELGGVVESIGIRSTKMTGLDKTLVTIPNAQFADLQIVNWSRNDILIERTIGLRYETNPDQMRYILAKIREMLHAHPKVDPETVRVRFSDYGDFALLFSLRIFVRTRNWNEYHAVQEDILFRIGDIIKDAGAEFAFPSQTVYLGKDEEPTGSGSETAIKEVQNWRRSNQFPFPKFADSKLEKIGGTLKYPPPGSPDAKTPESEVFDDSENLSSETFEEQQEDIQKEDEKKE